MKINHSFVRRFSRARFELSNRAIKKKQRLERMIQGLLVVVIALSPIIMIYSAVGVRAAAPIYGQTGQIGNPSDMSYGAQNIAIDTSGNYYVSNATDYYVRKYSPTGALLLQFGNQDWSDAVGQLGYVTGLDVKSNGEIYVSDGYHNRINIYSPAGQFLREITTFGASLTFNTTGRIAFGPSDKLYVIDNNGKAVQVFDNNDTYIQTYSNVGPADGQLSYVTDVSIDNSGNIYVTDDGNKRVTAFDSSWNFLWKTSAGGLVHPQAIFASRNTPDLLVLDSNDWTVKRYDMAGNYINSIGISDNPVIGGYGNGTGETYYAIDVVMDPANNVVVAQYAVNRLQLFSLAGAYVGQFGSQRSDLGKFSTNLPEVATDTAQNLYVADSDNYRIQKFDANGTFISAFGDMSIFTGHPESVAVSPLTNNIYVFDETSGTCNSIIRIFNQAGASLGTIETCNAGSAQGAFANMGVRLAFNSSGELYASDTLNSNGRRIVVFDGSNTYARQWEVAAKDTGIGWTSNVDFDASGNVYLVSSGSSYIWKYSPTGTLLAIYGQRTAEYGDGYLLSATDIEVAADGTMYVTEAKGSSRVSVFDSNGVFIRTIGSFDPGFGTNQFVYPMAIEMINAKLYVADEGASRIAIYDTTTGINLPSAPQNLAATSTLTGQIDLSWNAPASDGGSPVDSYAIEYSMKTAHPVWELYTQIPTPSTSFSMINLPAGWYNVRVSAVNRAGHSVPVTSSLITVQSLLQLQTSFHPTDPNGDNITDIGVYSDGSSTAISANLNNRLQFAADGTMTARLGTTGAGNGQMQYPQSIAIDASNNSYISDMTNRRISEYSQDGTLITNYSTGTRYPSFMTIDPTNTYLYVVTSPNWGVYSGRVDKYTLDGTFIATVVPVITQATALQVGTDGTLYIAHTTGGASEVSHYSADGTTLLGTYGQSGTGPGSIGRPSGVGVLSTGEVIVSDDEQDVLDIYKADGTFIGKFGGFSEPQYYGIYYGGYFHQTRNPYYVRVFNDKIYIPEVNNARVIVYSLSINGIEVLGDSTTTTPPSTGGQPTPPPSTPSAVSTTALARTGTSEQLFILLALWVMAVSSVPLVRHWIYGRRWL